MTDARAEAPEAVRDDTGRVGRPDRDDAAVSASQQPAGEIPAGLNGLTNLVWLRLYDNMLSGEVPDLSDMASLERFYVHQNQLTGGVPTELSDSVTHILLQRNMLTGDDTRPERDDEPDLAESVRQRC